MPEIGARSFRRFLTVAGQELKTHLAGPLFWVLAVLAGLATATIDPTALIPSGDAATGAGRLFINSRYAVAQSLGLVSFFVYSFFAAIMAGLSVLREDEHRISELLRSTPLTRAEHVSGRLAGICAALGLALALHVLVAIGLIQLAPGWNSEAVRGPFRLAHFVLPALAFAAPGIWFSAGLAFAVGNRTRQPMAVFAVPTALFLVTVYVFNSWTFSGASPFVETLLMILDPSGLRWLRQTAFSVDRGAAFYNSAPFGFDMAFLLCRLFAIGAPLLAIIASVRHSGRPRRTAAPPQNPPDPKAITFGPLSDLRMSRSAPSFLTGTMNTFRAELRELRSQPGLYLFALLVVAMVAEFALSAEIHDAPLLLTAGVIAVGTVEVITFLVCLLLLFSTVESVNRERSTRFASILYAAPLRTGALLLGKGLANAVLAGVVLALCAALALALLGVQEQGRVEVWPFVLVWGLVLIPSFFLWSAFVAAVLAVVRERTAAYAIGLAVLMLSGYQAVSGSATWLTNWTLAGALRWSDMGLFELNGPALLLNRAMAAGLGFFFAAVAGRLFARAEYDPAATMHRLRPANLLRGALRLVPFTLLPLAAGSVLAARIESGFQSEAATGRAEAYWRRNVAAWAAVEPAAATHVDLKVGLDPRRRSAAIEGSFRMINPTERAMRRLPFTVGPSFGYVAWTLDGVPAKPDDRSGLHVLTPSAPLLPGAEIRVGFSYSALFPEGATRNGGGVEQFVLPSGVALHTLRDSFLPVPGFVDDDNEEEDRKGPAVGNAVPFTTRIEVTAPSEYTVNSVGEKAFERTRGGSTRVVWESKVPVRALNIVAGRWNVRRGDGTAVFYHPAHPYNVDEMLGALTAARRRYSAWFAPYPWPELRLSEFPNEVSNAQGFPTNIPFSEGIGFLTRSGPRTRLAFVVTAHEAAHQWWGNLLNPGDGPGADVLIEGMAHYSTLLLLESELGLQERIAFAILLEERYGEQRRADLERPLVAINGDETVVQDKGAWVMWMLHNHLGRGRMLAGLQEFIRRYHAPEDGRFPTLQDLIEALRPYAKDQRAYQKLVDQWFFGVVLPQYRIRNVAAVESGGSWNVSATVENVGTGSTSVELAVVRGAQFSKKTLRLAPAQPRRVTWVVPFKPERIVVDPDALVLQSDRDGAAAELP
jgi:ABC-2 type transport system permease protein